MEIAAKVKSIIVDKLGVEESAVVPEASFTNDLGAEDAEKITTVKEAISYIEAHAAK